MKVLTTEYSTDRNKFNGKHVVSVKFVDGRYKFKVYQYFADYKSPKDSFIAHSKLMLTNRYKPALRWYYSPLRYLIAVWRAGYATDPKYGYKMGAMIKSVKKRL